MLFSLVSFPWLCTKRSFWKVLYVDVCSLYSGGVIIIYAPALTNHYEPSVGPDGLGLILLLQYAQSRPLITQDTM